MNDTDLKNILARLQHLEDLEAIRHTWYNYITAVDSEDWKGYSECFTTDGVLEVVGLSPLIAGTDQVYRGRREIMAFSESSATSVVNPRAKLFGTGHIGTNMQIDLEGDKATTLAYWTVFTANDTALHGTYQHRVRREPDRWLFEFLRISVRYNAKLAAESVDGQSLHEILSKPLSV